MLINRNKSDNISAYTLENIALSPVLHFGFPVEAQRLSLCRCIFLSQTPAQVYCYLPVNTPVTENICSANGSCCLGSVPLHRSLHLTEVRLSFPPLVSELPNKQMHRDSTYMKMFHQEYTTMTANCQYSVKPIQETAAFQNHIFRVSFPPPFFPPVLFHLSIFPQQL